MAVVRAGAAEPLLVGMEMSYPPFEMTDEAGNPAGVSVDLARALGEHLGRPVTFRNYPFAGLIPALRTGKVHLVISSMTATPERARAVDFSDPYARVGICMLVGKASPVEGWATLDAPGRTVAVKLGTTGHLYAQEHLKKARLLVLDKEAACALEVAQGKADAFIYDALAIYRHWQRHPETTRPLLTPLREEAWAVAFPKGEAALREEVNAFLKQYRAGGGFDKLAERWLAEPKKAFQERGVPFVF